MAESRLSFQCWRCETEITGPYDYVINLIQAHDDDHAAEKVFRFNEN